MSCETQTTYNSSSPQNKPPNVRNDDELKPPNSSNVPEGRTVPNTTTEHSPQTDADNLTDATSQTDQTSDSDSSSHDSISTTSDSGSPNSESSASHDSISSHTSSLIETCSSTDENETNIDFNSKWTQRSLHKRRVKRRILDITIRSSSSEENSGSDTDIFSSDTDPDDY